MKSGDMFETDVLIVGGGVCGLSTSMLLSMYGVGTSLVSKHAETAGLPKAHLLMQKTMELFHEVGVADAIYARGTPAENHRYVGWYAGLHGPNEDYGRELARLEAWGGGYRDGSWVAASPRAPANLTQNKLEPLLKARAEQLAPGSIHFNHNFLSVEQDAAGVTAIIEERASGASYRVRAKFLLACDGGRTVGSQLGVSMEGSSALATNTSIHFSADLSAYARDPEVLIRALLNPDFGVPGILVPMGPDQWGPKSREWVFHLVSMPGDHTLFDDTAAVNRMLDVMGLPDLKPVVHTVNRWPLDAVVASRFRVHRTFILGDGAHRMPPTGGHGLNTAVQDAYNLCWKIAAVLKGYAKDRLLDSYEQERRPTAQCIVAAALDNWGNQRHLTPAIGFSPQNTPERNWENLRKLWDEGQIGVATRRAFREGLARVLPTYNHLNLNFGYTYSSEAVVDDGSPEPESIHLIHVYQPSTRPGHSLPHAWVEDLHGRTALAELVASGRFTLIAGEEGTAWCEAACRIGEERGIPLSAFTVGNRHGDWLDLRYDWVRQREFSPGGAILVRPDRFVAWRSMEAVEDPGAVLNSVFDRILGSSRDVTQACAGAADGAPAISPQQEVGL